MHICNVRKQRSLSSTIEYTINGCLLFAQGQNLDSKVIISHNTFINFISSSQSLVRANVNNDVTFSNLLFFYNANFGNKNATLINVGDGAIGTLTFADNIRYNNGTSVINLNPFGGTAAPGYPNTVVPLAEANPFDGAPSTSPTVSSFRMQNMPNTVQPTNID